MATIRAGHGSAATRIAINDGTAQPGSVEFSGGVRHWRGEVTGFHRPGDTVTITVHASSDPGHVLTGQAQIKSARFPEDSEPVTEFIGRGSLDRKPLAAETGA